MNGNGPPLRSLRPFLLIAGLPAHWYQRKIKRATQYTTGGHVTGARRFAISLQELRGPSPGS